MTPFREIELKLETDAPGAAALKRHPLLLNQRPDKIEQSSVYYDTARGTLRKAGLSLRVRAVDGGFVQTVKQQNQGSAGLFARPEWERPVTGPEPDLAALAETPVSGLIDGTPLEPTIRSDACRSRWDIEGDDGSVELVLDEGSVAGGGTEQPFAELEIELKGGRPAMLFGFGRDLMQAATLRIGVLTKAERGQRLADGTASTPAKAEPVRLTPDMTAAEGFAAIAYSCLRHFRLNEPLVAGHDPGGLHQARVAMRRLRSAFSLFRPVITDAAYEALREELRWFTAELGDARNLDVMLKRLDGKTEALRPLLEAARDKAYERILAAIESDRLRLLLFDIVAWIETGKWRQRKRAARPLSEFAARALGKRWNKVEERARNLSGADPEQRHRLRIEVKKLRYAAEFLSSLTVAKTAKARQKSFLATLESMQQELGELNDRETARQMVGRLIAGHEQDKRVAAAAGRLVYFGSEQRPVRAAEKAAEQLLAIGPYWH